MTELQPPLNFSLHLLVEIIVLLLMSFVWINIVHILMSLHVENIVQILISSYRKLLPMF